MTGLVHLDVQGNVAIITICNPPVNVLSQAIRCSLMNALNEAEVAGVTRVILTGRGKAFVAGADAKEFDAHPKPPHLPDIVRRIETFPIPVIAAINGIALGGGLELALAARARIAAPHAVVGLPEVNLGMVPGAGGTQRLPRLIGIAKAVELISEGRTVSAAQAYSMGLVDALSPDPVFAASDFPIPRRLATGDLPLPEKDNAAIAAAHAKAERRAPRQIAPFKAIELVDAASQLPLSDGLALERETFLALKASGQAAALRHIFFSERAAMGQVSRGGEEITSAVIVGGGTMGAAIAYALGGIDISITLVETDEGAVGRARSNVAKLFEEAVSRGKSTAQDAEVLQAKLFSFQAGFSDLPPANLAIEAVFEDLAVKRQVFAALDVALPDTTLLVTNTSYLDVNNIAAGISKPERILGLHFFSPAHIQKLLEVVKGEYTSAETIATALRLAARLQKVPVLAGGSDGFIGNRILTRYRQVCDIALLEGALPWQVDAAMRDFGMAMGPYEVQDLSGLDIAYANRKRMGWKTKSAFRYVAIADRIVEETGRLGRKNGAGWYDYQTGTPSPSKLVEQIIIQESARIGLVRRKFDDGEIIGRATMAMIEEGLRVLEDGVAGKASDIDLVMVHGYGFPRWRGGPLHYAGRLGLAEVKRQIEALAAADPLSWGVPELLQQLVTRDLKIDELEDPR